MSNFLMVSRNAHDSARFLNAFQAGSSYWVEAPPSVDRNLRDAKYMLLHVNDTESAHELVLTNGGTWYIRTAVEVA